MLLCICCYFWLLGIFRCQRWGWRLSCIGCLAASVFALATIACSATAARWLEYAIAIIGAMALQGGPIFWVAGYRLHPTHTEDVELDPYSAKRGFWWSHMLWMIYPNPAFSDYNCYQKYAPDLARQGFYRWLDRYFLWLQVPLGLALYAFGGLSFVIYGMVVRTVFYGTALGSSIP